MSDHHVSFKDLPAGGEKFEPAKASKLVSLFGGLGALGIAGSIYYFSNGATRPAFSYSWLFAIFFSFTFVAGGCFWILLHNASNSSWGVVIRRLFENLGSLALPLGVLAVPLMFPGVQTHLWEWMNHHRAAGSFEGLEEAAKVNHHLHSLVEKYGYLNTTFWYVRFVLYFVILAFLSFTLKSKFLQRRIALQRMLCPQIGPDPKWSAGDAETRHGGHDRVDLPLHVGPEDRLIRFRRFAQAGVQEHGLGLGLQRKGLHQLQHLLTYSSVAERVKAGALNLHAFWFDIASGQVLAYCRNEQRYIPAVEVLARRCGDDSARRVA